MEREYIQGKPIYGISRKYGVGVDSLTNHLKNHTSRQLVQAWRRKQEAENLDLFSEMDLLVERTKVILSRAEKKQHDVTALRAIGELRGTYELMLRIAVALHDTRREELYAEQQRTSQEDNEEFGRKLSILNEEERRVFRMLYMKIQFQKPELDPLKEVRNENRPVFANSPARSKSGLYKRTTRPQNTEKTTENTLDDNSVDQTPRYRPIEPEQIPGATPNTGGSMGRANRK